jgi:hypothetical protein
VFFNTSVQTYNTNVETNYLNSISILKLDFFSFKNG